jgi:two-component system sensor histidine kinase AtoS
MTSLNLLILLSGILIVLVAIFTMWRIMLRFRRELGLQKQERDKSTETSFIINAFHEVTKQLKEKEKELERLKALAEQRAENVESYNENILQCVTSGVVTFDKDCRLTTLNRAAEEILGLDRRRATGIHCDVLFGQGDIARAVQDTMDSRRSSARMEAVYDRDQAKVWLGYNTAVLSDRQGDALGVILSFSDLTEVKRLQEQVELRERLTALGEMSAGIAHELRNPMAVMSGYLNLLSKKANSEQQAIIRNVAAEINGMNRIIGDLLTFARPAALNRVKINIKELVESCLANALQATNAESRIKADLSIDPVEVFMDEVLMRQVFTNLIQNAIEAIPDQGTVSLNSRTTPGELSVRVTDTGIGMSPDVMKKIFLPFFTTKDAGVGMGLALAHKIVASHGGKITVESNEGKGTTFTAVFPLR